MTTAVRAIRIALFLLAAFALGFGARAIALAPASHSRAAAAHPLLPLPVGLEILAHPSVLP